MKLKPLILFYSMSTVLFAIYGVLDFGAYVTLPMKAAFIGLCILTFFNDLGHVGILHCLSEKMRVKATVLTTLFIVVNAISATLIPDQFVITDEGGIYPIQIDFSRMLLMLTIVQIIGSWIILRKKFAATFLYFALINAPRFWNGLLMLFLVAYSSITGKPVYLG